MRGRPGDAVDGEGGDTATRAPRRRWDRRRITALVALLAAGVAVGTNAAGMWRSDRGHSAAGSPIPQGIGTATVARRTLVNRTTVDGTLGYAGSSTILDRLGGTFTWLPAVGAVLKRGASLFRIDNRPVILMYGSVPIYRRLAAGISDGPDVAELNSNLVALGYEPAAAASPTAHFGAATVAAVRRWQAALSLPQTGSVDLGRVVFADGAQRVTSIPVSLGTTVTGTGSGSGSGGGGSGGAGGGSGGGGGGSGGGSGNPAAKAASVQPSTRGHRTVPVPVGTGGATAATSGATGPSGAIGPTGPSGPIGPTNPSPTRSRAAKPKSKHGGSGSPKAGGNRSPSGGNGNGNASAATPVLKTTSTSEVVTVALATSQEQLVAVGDRAPVQLPDGRVVGGRVTAIGRVATAGASSGSGSGSGSPTINVTVSLDHAVRNLDQAPVSVQLIQSVRRNVLAVPATALIGAAGGSYAIEVIDGGRRRPLSVTPGLFANGYVEVSGEGVHAGMQITDSQ